jgi:hypothetical protein
VVEGEGYIPCQKSAKSGTLDTLHGQTRANRCLGGWSTAINQHDADIFGWTENTLLFLLQPLLLTLRFLVRKKHTIKQLYKHYVCSRYNNLS